jgi:hypothetical protein
MSLRASIRQVERRIDRRRGRLGASLNEVRHSIGERMVSPGALVTAGLIGAALQRDHRLHGLRMLAMLEMANATLRLLLTLSSRTRSADANR